MAGVGGWKIEVTNLRQVFNALEAFDKGAVDVIKKSIRAKGTEVKKSAQELTSDNPVSGWGPWLPTRRVYKNDAGRNLTWSRSAVISGFTVKQNNFKKRGVSRGIGYDVIQRNAAGAIFEVVGDYSRVGQDDARPWQPGRYLVDAINERFPRKKGPRTLVPAYYRHMTPEFREDVKAQIIAEARKAGLV